MRQTNLIFSVVALALVSAGCTSNISASTLSSASKETEARDTLNSLLFDQRTYFIENRRFTTSLTDLRRMNSRMDSPNYVYRIKPKPTQQKGIFVTATPRRPGLRSFTGVVFAVDAGKQQLMLSEICETTKPSTRPPAPPAAPARPIDDIQCPVGSNPALALLALQ